MVEPLLDTLYDAFRDILSTRMSLQWTLIAYFLYIEMFLVFLMLIPYISATRWHKIFKSKRLQRLDQNSKIYFNLFIGILGVLFFDSVKDANRFSEPMEKDVDLRNNPLKEAEVQMRLFRAQRNIYITGFALFLFLVLGRLVTLINQEAKHDLEQAAKEEETKTAKASEDREKQLEKDLNISKQELEQFKEDMQSKSTDLEVMKKQAQSTQTEYDRLLKEHAVLQEKLKKLEGKEESKKDS